MQQGQEHRLQQALWPKVVFLKRVLVGMSLHRPQQLGKDLPRSMKMNSEAWVHCQ